MIILTHSVSPHTSHLTLHTQDSPIPVWLSIQGLTICCLFIILFCGDTNQYFQVGSGQQNTWEYTFSVCR